MHVDKTFFYFVRPADYTYFLIFWMFEVSGWCFLSRSNLDSFVCSVMQFRSKTGLAPVLHLRKLIKSESSSSKDVLRQFWVEADLMVLGIKMYQY